MPGGPFARLARVVRNRAVMTFVDQGVVSAGNFLTGALLARHLSETEYGSYGVILETLLFLNGLQSALVVYPLTVRGASGKSGKAAGYATSALLFTLALLPLLGSSMAVGAVIGAGAKGPSASIAIGISAVAAMLLWQIQETFRRTLLADFRSGACIPGDAISYIGQLAAIWWLWKIGHLTLATTLISIGGTSAAAAIVQAMQIGLEPVTWSKLKACAADFWSLGRWTALTNSFGLVTGVGYFWTLRVFQGLIATAMFTIVALPLKLANPVILALGSLLVPAVSRSFHSGGLPAARRTALRYAGLGSIVLLPYFLLLVLIPTLPLALIFGRHSPYLSYAPLLRLYTINMIVYYGEFCLSSWLAGLGESRANFFAQCFNVLATLIITLPAGAVWGARGIILGGIAAGVVSGVAQLGVSFRFMAFTAANAAKE